MHPYVLALITVSLAQGLAMISPGPAFMLVSRSAAGESRALALATGAGVASAASVWALGALLGLSVLLAQLPALATAIQFAGAVYLIALGLSAWREAGGAPDQATGGPALDSVARGGRAAFRRGFLLSLGNPKIAFFYGGIFVSLIPAGAPAWLGVAAVALVSAQEFVWYALVATVFSRAPVQRVYGRAQARIERAMGAIFVALGARIAALSHL